MRAPEDDTAPTSPAEERYPLGQLALYGLPNAGVHLAFMFTTIYFLKFSTDVLLVAPWVTGLLLGLSKLWDAVSDPLAGHLSDRTRSHWGRRRSWIVASLVPFGAGYLMLWSPPAWLSGPSLAVWVALGLVCFYTGTTVFSVPHQSLAAELSTAHHERTRIFGVREGLGLLGNFLALGALFALDTVEDLRRGASVQALLVVAFMALAVWLASTAVRERVEYQGRGGARLWGAVVDVARNRHARLLFFVFGIESFGASVLGVVVYFALEYVYALPGMASAFLAMYMVPAILFIPVWVRLSRRFGKRNLWVFSMAMLTFAFSGLAFVREGDAVLISLLGIAAGIGGGCGQVVGPSIQADVIDFDEYATGERKEGVYFAVWNFIRKGAAALAGMLAGLLLSAVGYEPNVEQSESAKWGLRVLFGLVPGACYAVGTVAFLRFRLTHDEHDRIRRELDARHRERGAGPR